MVKNKLPGEFVPFYTLKGSGFRALRVCRHGRFTCFLFPGKHWTYTYSGEVGDPSGSVGGYNIDALTLAGMLADLDLWSHGDKQEFIGWYMDHSAKIAREGEIAKMKDLAKRLGYTVTAMGKCKD